MYVCSHVCTRVCININGLEESATGPTVGKCNTQRSLAFVVVAVVVVFRRCCLLLSFLLLDQLIAFSVGGAADRLFMCGAN